VESFFGCRQWFNVARNTATDEILAIYKIGEKPPPLESNEPLTPSGEPHIGSGNFSTSKK
jgi:sarcosine oxidase delta subunit